jgi:hypothetical protein
MDLSALPPPVRTALEKLFQTIPLNLPGGIGFNYLQAGLIVFLIFLLIYTIGHMRHTYVGWSIKGILPGLSFGFMLAIILEGLFLIGGKTLFSELIGWKDAPKPVSTVLDASREKIVDVLGVRDEIPTSNAATPETANRMISRVDQMDTVEKMKLQELLCDTE